MARKLEHTDRDNNDLKEVMPGDVDLKKILLYWIHVESIADLYQSIWKDLAKSRNPNNQPSCSGQLAR
jgi:hypothetical protein